MAEPLMVFEAVLTRAHIADFTAASLRRFKRAPAMRAYGIVFLVLTLLVTLGLLRWADLVARPVSRSALIGPGELVMIALLTGMLLTLGLTAATARVVNQAYRGQALRDGGSYLGPRRFVLDGVGLTAEGAHGSATTRWSAMIEVTEGAEAWLLWTDPGAAVIVPKDAFADPAARAAFATLVAQQIAAARHSGG